MLVPDFGSEGGCPYVGAKRIWEITVFSAQFCCVLKTALKNKVYLKGKMGFYGGSDSKESACSVGDPGLIPGLGRSPGEGNGYPLQYSFFFFQLKDNCFTKFCCFLSNLNMNQP